MKPIYFSNISNLLLESCVSLYIRCAVRYIVPREIIRDSINYLWDRGAEY